MATQWLPNLPTANSGQKEQEQCAQKALALHHLGLLSLHVHEQLLYCLDSRVGCRPSSRLAGSDSTGMLTTPACIGGALAVALPGPSLQEVPAVRDVHPSWVSTKQRRAPGQRCQKQRSPPQKAKQAPTSRPLCLCRNIATMHTCAGKAMSLKKAVAPLCVCS